MTCESDEDRKAQFPPIEKTGEISGGSPETLICAEKNRETFVFCRFLFVRGVAFIYLIAFFSVFLQIDGLFSSNGILPIADQMLAASSTLSQSSTAWMQFPTIFWISSSDWFLKCVCLAGMVFALASLFGIFCGPSLLLCWFAYLSFLTSGSDFMSYQWDILLLESGFLAALWAPWAMASPPLRNSAGGDGSPQKFVLWLLRWLLFRLMFMSGMCKLMSGDETWWGLTALSFHYETQPLPTPPAWLFSQLPMWFQQISCLIMFGIEIVSPFLIFGNVLTRRIAFGALAGLQLLILLTGNYTFFNWLTILLCCTLIDDSVWARVLPLSWRQSLMRAAQPPHNKWSGAALAQKLVIVPMVALVCFLNLSMLGVRTAGAAAIPVAALEMLTVFHQFHLVNGYGLFAVMTQKRIEIILEGSYDGQEWRTYEFAFKPGDLKRPPPVVAPLQPRLDWQMWFASLGNFEDNPWFAAFVQRILEGDKDVAALFSKNPFPDRPPLFLRAKSYQYHFSDAKSLFTTGNWWKREYVSDYMPVASLKEKP